MDKKIARASKKVRIKKEMRVAKPPKEKIQRMPPVVEKAVVTDWPKAVQNTLERLQSYAKLHNEPEAITIKKVTAVASHDPKNGSIAVANIGQNGKNTFLGIKIK